MRIFGGLLIGIVIVLVASGIHEGTHWLFIVPFDGSVADWHWLPNPGWDTIEFSPAPWGTVALFAGGLTASLFLIACLSCVIWRLRYIKNPFWWFLGAPLAFIAPLQFAAGILEGAANHLNIPAFFVPVALFTGVMAVALYWRIVGSPKPSSGEIMLMFTECRTAPCKPPFRPV